MRKLPLIVLSLIALVLVGGCAQKGTEDANKQMASQQSAQQSESSIDSGISGVDAEEEDLSDAEMEDMDSTLAEFEDI